MTIVSSATTSCVMVSYDLPIVCYSRDFFFEKINKVCLDFLEVKILTSQGRISSGGSAAPDS
jgi:hypothetical protein